MQALDFPNCTIIVNKIEKMLRHDSNVIVPNMQSQHHQCNAICIESQRNTEGVCKPTNTYARTYQNSNYSKAYIYARLVVTDPGKSFQSIFISLHKLPQFIPMWKTQRRAHLRLRRGCILLYYGTIHADFKQKIYANMKFGMS